MPKEEKKFWKDVRLHYQTSKIGFGCDEGTDALVKTTPKLREECSYKAANRPKLSWITRPALGSKKPCRIEAF